jgi:hypothetical protein
MDKQEAMDRIAVIEAEAAKLRAIIEAPVAMPPQVGRICFVSDRNPTCPSCSSLAIIIKVDKDSGRFEAQTGLRWCYARIATWDELGVPWVADMERLIEALASDKFVRHDYAEQQAQRILAMRDGRTE